MTASNHYDFGKLKILLVDDNGHMLELYRRILNALGIRSIEVASDATGAFETLRHFAADIVFCDWQMEPVDGVGFVHMVRNAADSPNPYVPVVMVTGFSDPELIGRARDAGVTEFLVKPVSVRAMYLRIVEVIERPRPFIRTEDYFGPDRRRGIRPEYAGPERRKNGSESSVVDAELPETRAKQPVE